MATILGNIAEANQPHLDLTSALQLQVMSGWLLHASWAGRADQAAYLSAPCPFE